MKTIICTPDWVVNTTKNYLLDSSVNTYQAIEKQHIKKTKRKQDD